MSDKSDIPEDDKALFRNSVQGVRRLKDDRHQPVSVRPKPIPVRHGKNEQDMPDDMFSDSWRAEDVETGDELLFARTGIQQRVIKQLRRGRYRIDAELDMHGMTVDQARLTLTDFIKHCLASGARCIRIVHGKGHGSSSKLPILKNKVNSWLRQCDEVLAFSSARPEDGGAGALYVLLKRL